MPVGTDTRDHLSLSQEGRRASPFYLGCTRMLRGTGVSPMGTSVFQGGRVLRSIEHTICSQATEQSPSAKGEVEVQRPLRASRNKIPNQ